MPAAASQTVQTLTLALEQRTHELAVTQQQLQTLQDHSIVSSV